MFVMKDGEKRYLRNWEYNACRIMTALQTIVENNGGSVKPVKKPIIENRTLSGAIRECKEKIERAELLENIPNERRAVYIANQKKELEKLESIKNDPIQVTQTTYITFVLDDVYYYYSVDENPFFPFHWRKTPIINGKYSLDAACDECKKEWLYDCFFTFRASDDDIKEAANLIFNMLVNAKNSVIIRDKKKTRVPNTYDGGYHYEIIYSKERFSALEEWAKC